VAQQLVKVPGMERKRTTGRDIRRQNRSALLSELFFHGPLSRLELAEITGLSPATASNVTAELIGERLIVEAGQVESDGGRPRVLLRVDPDYGYVIGVAVAETGVLVELFDLAMTRRAALVEPLSSAQLDAAAVADLIVGGTAEVLEAAGLTLDDVVGVGIAVPGIVERGISVLVHAPTIGWNGVALTQLLRDRGVRLPVFVENGAKTLGQAEMWFGAGRGARHAVIVLIGTGVGAAVVTDGTSYRGVSSSAGEWGHTTIMYGGRVCRCGAKGCLEAYVGSEGILERWRRARGGRQLPGDDPISQIEALVSSADRSKVAADLLDETADLIGAGIANLINLFNPERVLLGGWAGLKIGDRLIPRIREAAEANALAHLYGQATIELSTLGPGAVALGAATQPVAALLAGSAVQRPEEKSGNRGRPSDIDVA
jgi:predicted NBD/HSP70 family sugar kinase